MKKNKINKKLKTYFIIVNLVLGIIAFSYLISGETVTSPCTGESCPIPKNFEKSPSQAPVGNIGAVGVGGLLGTWYNKAKNSVYGGQKEALTTGGNSQNTPSVTPAKALDENYDANGAPVGWTPDETYSVTTKVTDTVNGRVNPIKTITSGNTAPKYTTPGEGDFSSDTGGGADFSTAKGPGVGGTISNYFDNQNFWGNLGQVAMGGGIGAMIGSLAGGKNGVLWGTISGAAGTLTYQVIKQLLGGAPNAGLYSGLGGIAVFLIIFLLTYKKESKQIVEFNCLPWQAPIGGGDCEKCNEYEECSEYTCKSLGQACDLVNQGTKNQKCIWKNPYDTNSPIIKMESVSKGHKFVPDNTIRPPATGVEITLENAKCIKAFTPLEFTFKTDEPSQCKIDYNLTSSTKENVKAGFENMNFYVGGNSEFSYNHTEKLSLPGPDAINKAAPELMNDGTYTLYVRCQDANGNFNQDAFSVRFCVEKGPDTTPPVIVNVSIPSGNPIQFNKSSLEIEVYVNEPADCKWSHEDIKYELMENAMSCDLNLWEMNNENAYTCKATLTGIESRKENLFYFRCKDKPDFEEADRNENKQSFLYRVIGTQPLNILEIGPTGTVYGATDTIPVFLNIRTDNGYQNGEARCYYSVTGDEEDYIEFSQTGGNNHTQRQDLIAGNYKYYFKCLDLGGNAAYNSTSFKVESDKLGPLIVRVYKESGELKIITIENAECSYSNTNCNFEIDAGIKMSSLDYLSHNAEWKANKVYYIRCKDKYNNQPNPNTCSFIARPSEFIEKSDAIEL